MSSKVGCSFSPRVTFPALLYILRCGVIEFQFCLTRDRYLLIKNVAMYGLGYERTNMKGYAVKHETYHNHEIAAVAHIGTPLIQDTLTLLTRCDLGVRMLHLYICYHSSW